MQGGEREKKLGTPTQDAGDITGTVIIASDNPPSTKACGTDLAHTALTAANPLCRSTSFKRSG